MQKASGNECFLALDRESCLCVEDSIASSRREEADSRVLAR